MHHYAVTPKRHGTRHGRWTAQAEQLLDLLNALGSTIFRQFLWQRAAELDLTYAQGQVLFHVAAHAGCRMGDVGKASGVTLPAVTHLVDRLEALADRGARGQGAGEVGKVHFNEGQDVTAGRLLFPGGRRPFEAAVAQAEANVGRDTAQVRQAEAGLAQRRAEVQQALANL